MPRAKLRLPSGIPLRRGLGPLLRAAGWRQAHLDALVETMVRDPGLRDMGLSGATGMVLDLVLGGWMPDPTPEVVLAWAALLEEENQARRELVFPRDAGGAIRNVFAEYRELGVLAPACYLAELTPEQALAARASGELDALLTAADRQAPLPSRP